MTLHKRLWEKDDVLGQTKWWYYDPDTDEAWIETVWDVEAYGTSSVEQQKFRDGTKMGDGMEQVAQIPMALFYRLNQQGVFDDQRAFRRWFQSDEAAPFKVRNLWFGKRT